MNYIGSDGMWDLLWIAGWLVLIVGALLGSVPVIAGAVVPWLIWAAGS